MLISEEFEPATGRPIFLFLGLQRHMPTALFSTRGSVHIKWGCVMIREVHSVKAVSERYRNADSYGFVSCVDSDEDSGVEVATGPAMTMTRILMIFKMKITMTMEVTMAIVTTMKVIRVSMLLVLLMMMMTTIAVKAMIN